MLTAKEPIDFPFAVINADDYYGKSTYRRLCNFLVGNAALAEYAITRYILKNAFRQWRHDLSERPMSSHGGGRKLIDSGMYPLNLYGDL